MGITMMISFSENPGAILQVNAHLKGASDILLTHQSYFAVFTFLKSYHLCISVCLFWLSFIKFVLTLRERGKLIKLSNSEM